MINPGRSPVGVCMCVRPPALPIDCPTPHPPCPPACPCPRLQLSAKRKQAQQEVQAAAAPPPPSEPTKPVPRGLTAPPTAAGEASEQQQPQQARQPLRLVIKADVQGSMEAVCAMAQELQGDRVDLKVCAYVRRQARQLLPATGHACVCVCTCRLLDRMRYVE